MRWTPGGRSPNLEDRRSAGGGMGRGLGIGGTVVVLALSLIFGRNLFTDLGVEPGVGAASAPMTAALLLLKLMIPALKARPPAKSFAPLNVTVFAPVLVNAPGPVILPGITGLEDASTVPPAAPSVIPRLAEKVNPALALIPPPFSVIASWRNEPGTAPKMLSAAA